MKKISCKDQIMLSFEEDSRMKTAKILKSKPEFTRWQVSTIKAALSSLKKEKKLSIGFRTIRGRKSPESKCYYQLR